MTYIVVVHECQYVEKYVLVSNSEEEAIEAVKKVNPHGVEYRVIQEIGEHPVFIFGSRRLRRSECDEVEE